MNQFMSLFYFTASIHIPEKYNLLFISNVSDNLDSVGTITNQIFDEFFSSSKLDWHPHPPPPNFGSYIAVFSKLFQSLEFRQKSATTTFGFHAFCPKIMIKMTLLNNSEALNKFSANFVCNRPLYASYFRIYFISIIRAVSDVVPLAMYHITWTGEPQGRAYR